MVYITKIVMYVNVNYIYLFITRFPIFLRDKSTLFQQSTEITNITAGIFSVTE